MPLPSYEFKLAIAPEEVSGYFALRRSIFVDEQKLFSDSDVDEIDQIAYPIVALPDRRSVTDFVTNFGAHTPNVLGIVRIYEPEPQLWYGGRLGVHPDFRRAGRIGKGLIDQAVTTANAWGCQRFLATVQLQNVRFFQRFHWSSLEELTICGLPHHLMEADLNYYPPNTEPRPIASHSIAALARLQTRLAEREAS
jgi:putative N-acetyltransferase (TIGR04045 family)